MSNKKNITGKIEKMSVDEGVSKRGKPYKRAVFTIGGKKYSTFDEDIRKAGFKVGDFVEATLKQDGKFWNMQSLKKIDKEKVKSEDNGNSEFKVMIDLLRKILAELQDLRKE